MADHDAGKYDGDLAEDIREKVKKPDMFKVVLHNDDYTTMEFVVHILQVVFHLDLQQATKIMLDVHNKGKGIVGVFTYDIARTKVSQVNELAKSNEFPLKCSIEKA